MKTLTVLMVLVVLISCGAREARSDIMSPCIIALDSTAANSLTASGNTTVTADCSFAVDSSSPAAVTLNGIASIALSGNSTFSVTGGVDLSGRAQISPYLFTGVHPVPDPFEFLPAPSVGDTCDFVGVVINDGSSTLNPGVYCGGIEIGGQATVTLRSGLYILQGGGLTVRGNSFLTGSGVMFYDTGSAESYEPIVIGNNSIVQLSAATSGTYAGVLFFASRGVASSDTSRAQTTNVFGGGAGSLLNGALYFPTQTVLLENFTAATCSGVVADKIEFGGDTQLSCPGRLV